MTWPATLGLAFLVYTPMAYLLLRGGYRRRMWVGAVAVCAVAVAPGLGAVLASVGEGSLLSTGAIVVWLAGVAALGFRPLVRTTPYPIAVTVGQVAVVGFVARLVERAVLPLSVPPLPERDVTTLAVSLGWSPSSETLAVTTPQLHGSLLAVGAVVFLLGVGNAHVHGPLGAADRGDGDR